MIVQELVTKIVFDTDKKGVNNFNKTLSGVKKGLAALGAGLLVRKAFTEVRDLVKDTVGYFDELGESSVKLGITTQALERLRFAGAVTGVAQETLAMSIKKVSKTLEDAKEGNKTALASFDRFGITKTQIKSFKTADEVMLAIANSKKKLEGTKKTNAYGDMFGQRSGSEMIAMLADAKKFDELMTKRSGMGLSSQKDLDNADKLDEKFNELGATFDVIKRKLGVQLFPVVSDIANKLSAWIVSADGQKSISMMADGMKAVGQFAYAVLWIFDKIGRALTWVGDTIGSILVAIANNKWLDRIMMVVSPLYALLKATGALDGLEAPVEARSGRVMTPEERKQAHAVTRPIMTPEEAAVAKSQAKAAIERARLSEQVPKIEQKVRMIGGHPVITGLDQTPEGSPTSVDKSQTIQMDMKYSPIINITAGEGFNAQMLADLVNETGKTESQKMAKKVTNAFPVQK